MANNRYQDYLYLIAKLKEVHGLISDAEHTEVHSLYKDKKHLFKLFFGTFDNGKAPSIVISFHIDLKHHEAIRWFIESYKIDNNIIIHDSFIEDDQGETYLGEDAEIIRDLYKSQEVLKDWLKTASQKQIENYTKTSIVGHNHVSARKFDSQFGKREAIIEFSKTKKPGNGESIH